MIPLKDVVDKFDTQTLAAEHFNISQPRLSQMLAIGNYYIVEGRLMKDMTRD